MARKDSHEELLESGEKQPQNKSVGFFHEELFEVRRDVIKSWALTTLALSSFLLAALSLYWGSLFHVEGNLKHLHVYVVDFDAQVAPYTSVTPIVGPLMVKVAQSLVAPRGTVGWQTLNASQFNNDPLAVRDAIYHEKAWAAIIINANATAMLQEAVANGNTTYDPHGAAQLVYVEARDQTTIGSYIMPQVEAFQSIVTAQFGKIWTAQVLANSSSNPSIIANVEKAPQVLSPGIGFTTYNLRPFGPPQATPTVTVGLIYLIIISFFCFMFYLPHHMKFVSPGHRPLHIKHLIIWRFSTTILAYFLLSLIYSFVSLAFQINFTAPPASSTEVAYPATAYGHGSFVVYWMVNFLGMWALGLACENMAMVLGMPWTSFWLIFWVITNVAGAFYCVVLEPRFYYWSYAWPLHNIVGATRTILFDTHSRIGLNFGVLIAWAAINTALFPLCCAIMGWRVQQQKKKEAQQKQQQQQKA